MTQAKKKKVPFTSDDFEKMMDEVLARPEADITPAGNNPARENPLIERLKQAGKALRRQQ